MRWIIALLLIAGFLAFPQMYPTHAASCDWGTNCSGSAGRVAGADWNAAMNLHNAWVDKSIATNAISIDGDGKYRVTSCGGNLQTITNASATSGDVIWLTIDGSGCTSMTIEDTTGNIELPGNANITVTSVEQIIPLIYNGTNYVAQLAGYVHLGGGQTIAGALTVTGALQEGGNDVYTTADTISKTVYWPAGAIVSDGTNCANPATATINRGPKQYTVICADNDSSRMHGHVKMQGDWNAGTVTFTVEYVQTAADTAVLNMDVACQARGATETVNSTYGTEVAIDDAALTGSNAVDQTTSAAVTCNCTTSCQADDSLWWYLDIDATGTTTAVATLHILGVTMTYTGTISE